jgi:hypothetical protein
MKVSSRLQGSLANPVCRLASGKSAVTSLHEKTESHEIVDHVDTSTFLEDTARAVEILSEFGLNQIYGYDDMPDRHVSERMLETNT